MTGLNERNPAGGPGFEGTGKRLAGSNSNFQYSPFARAAATCLARELGIVLLAADRMAAGHGLSFDDHHRLHAAHQHVLTVLANLTGAEVLQ